MNTKPTSVTLNKRLQRKLAAMGKKQPFIIGSLVKIQRRCGNPNCQCAKKGKKHSAHILTTKVEGKTRAIYIPVDMVDEVRKWCRQYRILKSDIKEISEYCEQLICLHVKEKRTHSAKQRKLKSV